MGKRVKPTKEITKEEQESMDTMMLSMERMAMATNAAVDIHILNCKECLTKKLSIQKHAFNSETGSDEKLMRKVSWDVLHSNSKKKSQTKSPK